MGLGFDGSKGMQDAGGDPLAKSGPMNPYAEGGGRDPYGQMTYGGKAAVTDPNGNVTESSAQQAADKYDAAGAAAVGRPGVQLQYGAANSSLAGAGSTLNGAGTIVNQGVNATTNAGGHIFNANEARGQQQDALSLQRSAALGQQPSQAELQGRNMLSQSLQGQLAGAASARGGPLAQMTAQRGVQQGAAGFQQQGVNSLAAMRAGEMADARNAYQAGASGVRAQDYTGANTAIAQGQGFGALAGQGTAIAAGQTDIGKTQAGMATSQGQADIDQRHLNQNEGQFQQGMAHDVREAEAQRGVEAQRMHEARFTQQSDKHQHEVDRDTGVIGSIAGGIGGFLGGIASDMRAKIPVSIGDGAAVGKSMGQGARSLIERGDARSGGGSPQRIRESGNMEEMRKIQASFGEKDEPTKQWERINGPSPTSGGLRDQAAPETKWDGVDRGLSTKANPYGEDPVAQTWGAPPKSGEGFTRDDPYQPGGGMFFSDEAAKREVADVAFEAGRQHAAHHAEAAEDTLARPMHYAEALTSPLGAMRLASYEKNRSNRDDGPEPEASPPLPRVSRGPNEAVSGRKSLETSGATSIARHAGDVTPGPAPSAGSGANIASVAKSLRLAVGGSDDAERERLSARAVANRREAPIAPARGLETSGATSIARHAGGERPLPEALQSMGDQDPRRYDFGGSSTAQGRELPGTPAAPFRDQTGGLKPGPFQYSDNKTKDAAKLGGTNESVQQDANRRGAGFGYAYKGQFTPNDQESGELNYGPSANELEKNPLTATAIKRDPKTGLRMVDGSKLLKTNTAGIADLQKQIDEMRNGSH